MGAGQESSSDLGLSKTSSAVGGLCGSPAQVAQQPALLEVHIGLEPVSLAAPCWWLWQCHSFKGGVGPALMTRNTHQNKVPQTPSAPSGIAQGCREELGQWKNPNPFLPVSAGREPGATPL